jgi:hypothetical protein
VTKGNAVRDIVDLVAVQADISQFACVKFGQCILGLVLNTQSTKICEDFCQDHFITYFKPADCSASVQITGMFSPLYSVSE